MKKKRSQFNIHNDGNVTVILSLKELLNVSSDWTDVKNRDKSSIISSTGPQGSMSTNTGSGGGSVPADFQSTQIEKIIDALTLALPQRGAISTKSSNQFMFQDSDIKELSYDLGVDPRILKYKLQQTFKPNQGSQYF